MHFLASIILLTGAWEYLFSIGNSFYDDPFHDGELVASLPYILSKNIYFFTIHGAWDWIPAFASQQLFGSDRHFLPTKLMCSLLSILASTLLYFTVNLLLAKDSKYRYLILLQTAILSVYLVGIRDLFLILSIYLYFLSKSPSSQTRCNFLEITLGVSLALNLLWSLDRGVVGLIGIGFACMLLTFAEKRYLLSIISFVISILILSWIGALSIPNYIANILFLLKTSSQWSHGLSISTIPFIVLSFIPNAWAIYYLIKILNKETKFDWRSASDIFMLLIINILMYKISINRADIQHAIMSLWMPSLTFIYLCKRYDLKFSIIFNISIIISLALLAYIGKSWLYFGTIVPVAYLINKNYPHQSKNLISFNQVLIILTSLLILSNVVKVVIKYTHDKYIWIHSVLTPPLNQSLVSEGIQWVSKEILKSGSICVFDLSNSGAINGLTNLPACTKYNYPVYATQRYEPDIMHQLKLYNPTVVVFSSTSWTFRINESMHDRFPEIKDYIVKTYPFEVCNFGYCLRYLYQPN